MDHDLATQKEAKEILDEALNGRDPDTVVRISTMADPSIGLTEEELLAAATRIRQRKEESHTLGKRAVLTVGFVAYVIVALLFGTSLTISLLNGSSDLAHWGGMLLVPALLTGGVLLGSFTRRAWNL